MNEKNDLNIDSIIKTHVIFAMTAGAIPIPLVDFVAISAIQMDLIKQIGDFYGADYDSNSGKSLASSMVGTSFAKIGSSVVKAIPGVGTAIGIGSQIILAGASTYALGKVFENHYSENSTLSNFNVDVMKEKYNSFFEKGKDMAKKYKKESSEDDILETIEKLNKLKESGAITEKDFESTKKKLLEKLQE